MRGDQQEHERADDDRVAVVGRVALRDAGPPDGLQPREVGGRGAAGEAGAAVREVDRGQHDVHGAGRHQRDQREVEAAQAEGRQADQHAHDARDRAGDEQQDRERQVGCVRDPRRRPGADREQRDLAERDHADAAVQRHEARGDHRVDRDCRQGLDPVPAEHGRQDEQRDAEEGDDHRAAPEDAPRHLRGAGCEIEHAATRPSARA